MGTGPSTRGGTGPGMGRADAGAGRLRGPNVDAVKTRGADPKWSEEGLDGEVGADTEDTREDDLEDGG